MKRIRSLDGMRAVSIIMVLLAHASDTMPEIISKNRFFSFIANSDLGVKVFFAISGYLITKLLIVEKEKTGNVSLRNFYIRRVFRIFPIFYLYIVVLILLKCFYIPTVFESYKLLGVAALYLWNYEHLINIHITGIDNGFWFFGHFWTLSMEEQFYLLWPLLFIKVKEPSLKKVVIAMLIAMPFLRVLTYFFMPGSSGQMGMMLQTGGDTILIGCLGALVEKTEFFKEKVLKAIHYNGLIICLAVFLFIISPILDSHFKGMYNLPIGRSLDNLCIIMLIFWCVYVPSKVSDLLNTKVLIQIGLLSYSLYIWQQLFFTNRIHFWVNQFPQNIFVVFAVGFVSYYGIEKPILSLKKRFKKV